MPETMITKYAAEIIGGILAILTALMSWLLSRQVKRIDEQDRRHNEAELRMLAVETELNQNVKEIKALEEGQKEMVRQIERSAKETSQAITKELKLLIRLMAAETKNEINSS